MLGLLIDTSIDTTLLALSDGTSLPLEQKASDSLLPAIESLIKGKTLDYIAVGTGPGAFTGTRIGVMAAKALSFALELPLIPFCSLMRLIPQEEGPFTALIDAKSRGHYALTGHRGKTITFETPVVIALDEPLPAHTLVYKPSTFDHIITYVEKRLSHPPLSIEISYLHTP